MYEREVKDYCRRAGSLLACGRAQRQRFDRLTRQSVREYLQEVPGASWPEVEQTLGSRHRLRIAKRETQVPGQESSALDHILSKAKEQNIEVHES